MDESEALRRFGLRPAAADLPALREILAAETRKESAAQGDGDTELMKLCCVQLFHAGLLEDVARIWAAKRASFDAGCSIDVQLLCGAGLEATKRHLGSLGLPEAREALKRVLECEAAGDFNGFSVESTAARFREYYGTG